MSRSRASSRTAAALIALLSLASTAASAASPPPVTAPRGIVVGPERRAAEVAREALRGGGNAVDAAVAMAFALAVTYPRAGNLGGGGFLLYRTPDGAHHALDFRETAPQATRPELYLGKDGAPDPVKIREGGLAVGVPGSVAGLWEAHRRWGSRPWSELLAPAVALARDGVTVSAKSAAIYAEENARLARDPAARAIFTRDGAPLGEGDRVIQADLAATLAAIAERGPEAFYSGSVARAIVESVRAAGGVMTEADLASYRPVERVPLEGRYRGYRVVGFPPPSSGGIVLLEVLGMLERFDMKAAGAGSSLALHRIAEAERRAFADRSRFLGDPASAEAPFRRLLDPAYLASRSATIADGHASSPSEVGPGLSPPAEGHDTLHLSVADAAGGAVALTTTLNSWFGAAIVARGTGILLNNEMDDFSLPHGVANQFGLVGGEANAPRGGKRPLSSMCPTIVEDPVPGRRPRLVLGSKGGPHIISSVLETLLHVLDDGMTLQEAVDAVRIHDQWSPDAIEVEPYLPEDVAAALRARGHRLSEVRPFGNVAAIGLDDRGRYTGAADPREEGVALGY